MKSHRILAWAGLGVFMAGIALSTYFDHTLPTSPDPIRGATYQLNTHGHYVYMTFVQNLTLNCMLVIGWTVGMAAVVAGTRERRSTDPLTGSRKDA